MNKTTGRVVHLSALPKLCIFIVMLAAITSQVVSADSFCTEGTATAPVQFNTIVKKSFSAEIYSVDLDKRTSMRGHEHYSASSKISAVYLSPTHDEPFTKFFIYYQKEKFGVINTKEGGCEKVSDEPTFGLMSWKVSQARSVKYVRSEEVAGETLHNWRACYSDNEFEYSEDLYTSGTTDKWGAPLDDDYTPVKMILRKRDKSNDKKSQINHYFLRFQTRDDNDKELKGDLSPPVGYTCPESRVQAIPSLPLSIIYTSEPTDLPQKPIEYIVDTTKQVIVTIGELDGRSDQYVDLDNYKLGVKFAMPDADGNSCKITAYAVLGDSELNTSLSYQDSYGTKPFETVDQFLGHGDGFTFNGVHICRGIPCIAFSKHFDNYRGTGKANVILYFSSAKIKNYSSVGRDTWTNSVLLRKDVWQNGNVIYEHNIYNAGAVDYTRLDFDVTDISACQGQMGQIEFTLLFESKNSATKENFAQRETLKAALKSELAKTTGVNELRIHMMDVLLESGKLMAQVRLLGPLSEDTHILEVSGSIKDKNDVPADKFISSISWHSYYCKEFLEQNEKNGANFASNCDDTTACSVYKNINPNELKANDDCRGYFISKNKVEPVKLDDAWSKLTDSVDSGKFEVRGYKASKVAKFDASSVHNLTIPNLLKYRKIPGAAIDASMAISMHSSLVECSDSCTASLSYQCQVFTFCEKDNNKCVLNPEADAKVANVIQPNKFCDVYVRKYVTEFTAMDLTSAAIDKEMVFEQIDDPEICARLCVDLTDFRCESFDFCSLEEGGGSGTCSLFRKHYFDVVQSDQTVILPHTRCTHYSRNYLGDYDRKEGITDLPIKTKVRKSSPEDCAQSCSAQDTTSGESRCTVFQFCPIGGICEFVDESSLPSDASRHLPKLRTSLGCATYSLKKNIYLIHGNSRAQRASASRAMSAKVGGGGGQGGYGSGSMAGLAFGMLILGAGLLVLGLFVWARYQKPGGLGWFSRGSGKEMSMKFSKEDLD